MQIIAMMPVRNEAWILDRTLRSLRAFCDVVLVADQRSDDGTREILARHAPKVVVTDNDDRTHSTCIRWRLLEAARNYDGRNLLLFTDADEIVSANILAGDALDRLTSVPPGTAVRLELVNLWRSPVMWRADGPPWGGRWMEIGFRDDHKVRYEALREPLDHGPRVPACPGVETFEDLKLLHFQFVQFSRMLSKQRRYRAMEAIEIGTDKAEEINLRYCVTRDERRHRLERIEPDWTAGWAHSGIDLTRFAEQDLYWYDVEVLRCFAARGVRHFAPIDLWDVDWEEKRRLAEARGCEGLPQGPLTDPRDFEQRCYHAWLHRFFHTPPWRDPKELARMPVRWLRRGVRAAGLRRRHLARLGLRTAREGGTPETQRTKE